MSPLDVRREAAAFGFELSDAAAVGLGDYLSLLIRWNRAINLTGAHDGPSAFRNLVIDSLHLERFLRREGVCPNDSPVCWDLGAGAGLPGIPLRCLWDGGTYTLVESREKRVLFLRTFLALHPLPGTGVFHGRAEAFMPAASPADLIVSRAFMPWRGLLTFVSPYLARHGRLVLLLNRKPDLDGVSCTVVDTMRYRVGCADRHFVALEL